MNTTIRIKAAALDAEPIYCPGAKTLYPRLIDRALVGQRCVILSSLLRSQPPYRAIAHEIQIEDGRCFSVYDYQIGAE